MGNLPIILVPAICDEDKSPFGNRSVCRTVGLSYASFSMAVCNVNILLFLRNGEESEVKLNLVLVIVQLGGFYIWTYTFRLIKGSATKIKAMEEAEKTSIKSSNGDLEADHKTHLLAAPEAEKKVKKEETGFWRKVLDFLHEILEELLAPPTLGAVSLFY